MSSASSLLDIYWFISIVIEFCDNQHKTGANEMYRNRIRVRGLKVVTGSNSKITRSNFLKASTSNSVPVHFICACLTWCDVDGGYRLQGAILIDVTTCYISYISRTHFLLPRAFFLPFQNEPEAACSALYLCDGGRNSSSTAVALP
eukprot:scaffold13377_cov128-Skeletonema_dohrnii-CCMP3373.AAC.3